MKKIIIPIIVLLSACGGNEEKKMSGSDSLALQMEITRDSLNLINIDKTKNDSIKIVQNDSLKTKIK